MMVGRAEVEFSGYGCSRWPRRVCGAGVQIGVGEGGREVENLITCMPLVRGEAEEHHCAA